MQRQVKNLTLLFYLVLNVWLDYKKKTFDREDSRADTSANESGGAKPSHLAGWSRGAGSSYRGDEGHMSYKHQSSQPQPQNPYRSTITIDAITQLTINIKVRYNLGF